VTTRRDLNRLLERIKHPNQLPDAACPHFRDVD
jgi:hypothetical protein